MFAVRRVVFFFECCFVFVLVVVFHFVFQQHVPVAAISGLCTFAFSRQPFSGCCCLTVVQSVQSGTEECAEDSRQVLLGFAQGVRASVSVPNAASSCCEPSKDDVAVLLGLAGLQTGTTSLWRSNLKVHAPSPSSVFEETRVLTKTPMFGRRADVRLNARSPSQNDF